MARSTASVMPCWPAAFGCMWAGDAENPGAGAAAGCGKKVRVPDNQDARAGCEVVDAPQRHGKRCRGGLGLPPDLVSAA